MHGFMRQRERKSPAVLVMTFMIGFAIGFTTCYALIRSPLPELADPSPVVDLAAPSPDDETAQAGTPAALDPSASAPSLDTEPDQAPETPAQTPPAPPTPEEEASLAELEAMADTWPARHLFVGVEGLSLDPATQAFLAELKPGGVVLRDRNIRDTDQTIALVGQIKQAVGLGTDTADLPLIAVSQEGGVANPLKLETAPSPAEIGRAYDPATAASVGQAFARECLARGVGVLFAPVLDIARPGASPAHAARCFSTDRSAVVSLGMAFADGAAAAGVIPVAKYYPGGGATAPRRVNAVAVLDGDVPAVASAIFLFSEAVPCAIPGIMAGHIAVPVLDPGDPPRPASLSPVLVRTTLRGRLKYDGVVISDDLSADSITRGRPMEQAAVQALVAGCDALVIADADPGPLREVCDAIQDAIDAGGVSVDELAKSKRRLEAWQTRLRAPAPLTRPLPELPPKQAEAPSASEADSPAMPAPEATPELAEEAPGLLSQRKIIHEIKPGEMLSRLAVKYGVSQEDIMRWNDLEDKNLKYGFSLVIYVPGKGAADPAAQEPATPETPAPTPPEAPAETPGPESTQPEPAAAEGTEPDAAQPEPAASEAAEETSPPVAEEEASDDAVPPESEPSAEADAAPEEAEASPTPVGETVAEAVDAPREDVDAATETAEAAPTETEATPEAPADTEPSAEATPSTEAVEAPAGMKRIVHEIRPGEMLSRLAVKYGVSQDDIMKWNDLKDENLKYGFGLDIYVPEDFEVPPPTRPADTVEPEKETPTPPGTKKVVYTIKQGDALSLIAQRYGVSQQDIINWNNLTADKIKHGFTLTIYVPETPPESPPARGTRVYKVAEGDTVASVAERFGVSSQELLRLNGLQEGFALQEGHKLNVPITP